MINLPVAGDEVFPISPRAVPMTSRGVTSFVAVLATAPSGVVNTPLLNPICAETGSRSVSIARSEGMSATSSGTNTKPAKQPSTHLLRSSAIQLRRQWMTMMGLSREEIETHCADDADADLAEEIENYTAMVEIKRMDESKRAR